MEPNEKKVREAKGRKYTNKYLGNPPKVGGRYLLFLTRDVQTPDDTGKDFHILTGYELRDGRVHLLDDTLPGHPITRYKGNTETTLLTDLFNTVAKTSNLSN